MADPERAKPFPFDGHAVGMQIVAHVKAYLDQEIRKATEPLKASIAALERDNAEMRAEQSKSLHYAGVWAADKQYPEGALVTRDGSMWLSLRQHSGVRPGSDPACWKLTAKRDGT